jgi:Membrane-anchored protein predicted to be involved in regulation of amylopullulanase
MKIKLFLGSLLLLLLTSCLAGFGFAAEKEPAVYFEMKDPIGDEHGYGNYHYPSNIAFKPYQGLFDITEFKVLPGEKGYIYFDTSFATVTNPWVAPEGFIHQNIRIFVNKQQGRGLTVLPHPGANVKLDPKYGWEIGLRIVGWGNSQLLTFENQNTVRARPLKVELLADGHTIRAYVPEQYTGTPLKSWHYYVLAGSYDGFGEDFFRKVAEKSGEWVIGGSSGSDIEPRILDLLAPSKGAHNQERQLRSFDPQAETFAVIYPVGGGALKMEPVTWLYICLIVLCISGIIYLFTKRPKHFSWFWVHQNEDESKAK